jgi:hypothetical protein
LQSDEHAARGRDGASAVRAARQIDVTNALHIYDQIAAAVLRPDVSIVITDMTAMAFCDGTSAHFLVLARAPNLGVLSSHESGHIVCVGDLRRRS